LRNSAENRGLFHDRLIAVLQTRGEKPAGFSRKSGLSQSGFHRIVHGGEPTLSTLVAISTAASASIEWLAAGTIRTSQDCRYEQTRLSEELSKNIEVTKSCEDDDKLCEFEKEHELLCDLMEGVSNLQAVLEEREKENDEQKGRGLSSVYGAIEQNLSQPALSDVGAPFRDATKHVADAWLMGRVIDGIQKTYKETGARLSPASVGELAARIHNEIVDLEGGEAAWQGALALALNRLRTELADAAIAGSDKSSASS